MPHSSEVARLRDESEKRVNYLWGLLELRTPGILKQDKSNEFLKDIELYGLGDKRTMEQFWQFVACDPYKQNITVFDTAIYSGGGLKRVPWNEPYNKLDPLRNQF